MKSLNSVSNRILLFPLYLMRFYQIRTGFGKEIRMNGGDEIEVEENNLEGTFKLSRGFGSNGTTLIAILTADKEKRISIVNARIEGFTRFESGSKAGVGVKFLGSSLEEERQDGVRIIKAYISFMRQDIFALQENVTYLVGKLIVKPKSLLLKVK